MIRSHTKNWNVSRFVYHSPWKRRLRIPHLIAECGRKSKSRRCFWTSHFDPCNIRHPSSAVENIDLRSATCLNRLSRLDWLPTKIAWNWWVFGGKKRERKMFVLEKNLREKYSYILLISFRGNILCRGHFNAPKSDRYNFLDSFLCDDKYEC